MSKHKARLQLNTGNPNYLMKKTSLVCTLLCLLLSTSDLRAHIPRSFHEHAFTDISTETIDEVLKGVNKACYSIGVWRQIDPEDKHPRIRSAKEDLLENEIKELVLPILQEYEIPLIECAEGRTSEDEAFIWLHISAQKNESDSGADLEITFTITDYVQSLNTREIFRINALKIELVSAQIPLDQLESRIRSFTVNMVESSVNILIQATTDCRLHITINCRPPPPNGTK